jgi:hypothetical protein
MRNLIACVAVALGLACAAQKPPLQIYVPDQLAKGGTEVAQADHRKIICKYEMLVGTHIPEKTCRYEDEIDDARRETQDMIRAALPKGPVGN